MTQKLGLAACFLSERDLYVLDEPMSGLDPKARARAKDLMLKLMSEGRTLLFTSHSLADIEEVCDDMSVLHRGTLAYTGAPSWIVRTPWGSRRWNAPFSNASMPMPEKARPSLLIVDDDPLITETLSYAPRKGLRCDGERFAPARREPSQAARRCTAARAGRPRLAAPCRTDPTKASNLSAISSRTHRR